MSQRVHHLDLHYLTNEELHDIESNAEQNMVYQSPPGVEKAHEQRPPTDTQLRWMATIDGRYSFLSQNLTQYFYTAFIVITCLLAYIVINFSSTKAALRFVYAYLYYSALAPHPRIRSFQHRVRRLAVSAWWCRLFKKHASRRRTMVVLLCMTITIPSAFYSFPLIQALLAPPSAHLPLSYFTSLPSTPLSVPASACPVTLVTALYDTEPQRHGASHWDYRLRSFRNLLRGLAPYPPYPPV